MPSKSFAPILPPATVAVTGANGYIASHVVSQLLEAGYRVIGTVRSAEKAQQVQKVHNAHEGLSLATLSDITSAPAIISAAEAFLDAREELQAIIHLAAPFSYSVTDFEQDLLIPAVKGSEAILGAARHFQTRGLKRVVHTDSFACIYDATAGAAPDKTYTAKDWSPLTYEDGLKATSAPEAYRAAKSVAEKIAWAFMEREQGLEFDLVSLCPGMVFGPFLSNALPAALDELNESNKIVWDVVGRGRDAELPPTRGPVWCDVRDVARAHILALTKQELGGERLMLAAGVYCTQEIADEARVACPKYGDRIPIGRPGAREADKHFGVDASEEAELLGLQWRTLRASLVDLVPQLFAVEDGGRAD
jgi:nucleoside-diphosphate-sugar epimerase